MGGSSRSRLVGGGGGGGKFGPWVYKSVEYVQYEIVGFSSILCLDEYVA